MRVSHKISKAVSIEATVNYANTDKRGVGTSGDNGRFNMLAQILRARPTAGLKMTDEELLASSIDPLELESSESLSQVNPIKQAESVINTTKTEMWSGQPGAEHRFRQGMDFPHRRNLQHLQCAQLRLLPGRIEGGLPQRPDSLWFDPHDPQRSLDEFQLPDL